MDIKKYLQQRAEEEYSSVLSESDKQYCEELAARNGASLTAVKDRRKLWVCISCSAAVLLAAIITLLIIFVPHQKKPLTYLNSNVVQVSSTIVDLNNDAKYFNIVTLENTLYDVNMHYDSVSNDKLFYRVNLKGFFENSSFVIVINNNYNFEYEKCEDKIKDLDGYTLNYGISSESIEQTKYTGWISLKTETVYITYTQVAPLGDEAFFNYVQSVLQVK